MTNKRITLSSGDWIKLSDIPNEQVFNLVKQCFINAGFNDNDGEFAQWYNAEDYKILGAGLSEWYTDLVEFTNREHKRQLSLSDVFNSVNGGMDWCGLSYLHICKNGLVAYSSEETLELILTDVDVTEYEVVVSIKHIPEHVEAIISPKVSQWWDYEKGVAVGLPEKNTVVLYNGNEYEVIRATHNDTNDMVVLLCLNTARPNSKQDVFWESIYNITPLDYKTPKQIAVDMALDLAAQNMSFEVYTERLYDAGLLKAI